MAWIGKFLYDTFLGPPAKEDITTTAPAAPELATITYNSDRYQPSITDVFAVKDLLRGKYCLPLELVDVCIDHAEYWPHTSASTPSQGYPKRVRSGVAENQFLVAIHPF